MIEARGNESESSWQGEIVSQDVSQVGQADGNRDIEASAWSRGNVEKIKIPNRETDPTPSPTGVHGSLGHSTQQTFSNKRA